MQGALHDQQELGHSWLIINDFSCKMSLIYCWQQQHVVIDSYTANWNIELILNSIIQG